MNLSNDQLKRMLKSKLATIKKLSNQIKEKNKKEERRNKANHMNQGKSGKKSQTIIEDTNKNDDSSQNQQLKAFFIKFLEENSKIEPNARKYPNEILDICFAIYSISPNAYETFRNVLDLPCKSTLSNHFSDIIKEEKNNLLDISNIPSIIHNYRCQNNIVDPFDIVLGIDAFSFDRFTAEGKKYNFCFYAQPGASSSIF